ncbi:hypothetical protein WN48_04136 [Eufriesea mexicana]|uniref:Uncharacterized protein n=1 Tax=Eufriesea mexicana TaxID=516756 RepID=A0A310SE08_9HYME|nr:hypothetical protein WN48_04136 [Eufriesea mexicana]
MTIQGDKRQRKGTNDNQKVRGARRARKGAKEGRTGVRGVRARSRESRDRCRRGDTVCDGGDGSSQWGVVQTRGVGDEVTDTGVRDRVTRLERERERGRLKMPREIAWSSEEEARENENAGTKVGSDSARKKDREQGCQGMKRGKETREIATWTPATWSRGSRADCQSVGQSETGDHIRSCKLTYQKRVKTVLCATTVRVVNGKHKSANSTLVGALMRMLADLTDTFLRPGRTWRQTRRDFARQTASRGLARFCVALFRSVNTTLTFYSMERGSGGGGSLELAGGGGGGGGNTDLCLQDLVTGSTTGLSSVQHHQHPAAAASMAGLHGDHLQGTMHHHDLHGNSHHDAPMLHDSSHPLHEPLEKLKRNSLSREMDGSILWSFQFNVLDSERRGLGGCLSMLNGKMMRIDEEKRGFRWRKLAFSWCRFLGLQFGGEKPLGKARRIPFNSLAIKPLDKCIRKENISVIVNQQAANVSPRQISHDRCHGYWYKLYCSAGKISGSQMLFAEEASTITRHHCGRFSSGTGLGKQTTSPLARVQAYPRMAIRGSLHVFSGPALSANSTELHGSTTERRKRNAAK